MAMMGNYCKAYLLKQFRAFPAWQEQTENLRPPFQADPQSDDSTAAIEVRSLTDEDIFYLQENYRVTDGVFSDEYIIFDAVTDDWKAFCRQQLGFAIPDYASAKIAN
jgi:hypothetical protein